MKRRIFMLTFCAGLATASMAAAETYADQIVRQLTEQGYGDIRIETTLLGRVRIKGTQGDGLREIVINPNTGEILRDIWLDLNGNPIGPKIVSSSGSGSSGSGSGSDDGDNSGSGSGDGDEDNSGSGSGGDDDKDDDSDDDRDDDSSGKGSGRD